MHIKIVPFKKEYAQIFHDLNIAWLENYFYVEEHDKVVLGNPQHYIIDNHGYIFFALYNEEVAGTVALMNEATGYELSKMAVSPNYQGLKIGQQLMQYCIDIAKEKKWDQLILYSHLVHHLRSNPFCPSLRIASDSHSPFQLQIPAQFSLPDCRIKKYFSQ